MPVIKPKLPTVMADVIVERQLGAKTPQGGRESVYIRDVIEVEVLTVHFNKQTMRIRYIKNSYGEGKVTTCNINAEPYFDKYGWPE